MRASMICACPCARWTDVDRLRNRVAFKVGLRALGGGFVRAGCLAVGADDGKKAADEAFLLVSCEARILECLDWDAREALLGQSSARGVGQQVPGVEVSIPASGGAKDDEARQSCARDDGRGTLATLDGLTEEGCLGVEEVMYDQTKVTRKAWDEAPCSHPWLISRRSCHQIGARGLPTLPRNRPVVPSREAND